MKRWLTPFSVTALAVAAGCADTSQPLAPGDAQFTWSTVAVTDEYAADPRPVHGAIFTTLPDGGAVNANKYTQKIQVYLDGGPRNPNSHAAGLPNGLFVFQITDPPGKVLLSDDPAKCRIVQVAGGVITNIVRPSHLPASAGGPLSNSFRYQGRGTAIDCHAFDGDNGQAGPSGRHDWNTDTDLGGGIVVQMMPFLDTPNPGGVYKAWMVPLKVYLDNGGSLENQTSAIKVSQRTVGYRPDIGFKNPSRRNVKTDNFRVVDNPPYVDVVKYEDRAPYGTIDGDIERLGWPILVLDPVDGGEGGGYYTTPSRISVTFDTPVTVCEEGLDGWSPSYAIVDGEYVQPEERTDIEDGKTYYCVTVTAGKRSRIAIAFGNLPPAPSLQVVKTPSSQTVASGDPLAWQITVTNNGGGAAYNVVLRDQLPDVPGGSYSVVPGSSTCDVNGSLLLTCAVGTLNVGQSFTATVTLRVTAGQFCGTLTNIASARADRISEVYSNTATATFAGCEGRMTGGTGKVEITSNLYLTAGFTIHCDILLSNNLEINWPGNKWHIAKPITSARCYDDPNVSPGQPDAPFDTFVGTATGSLNGVPGSTVSFKFVDAGEPGKTADRASITIWDSNGNKVLEVLNQNIRGNLQAHEDQPHR